MLSVGKRTTFETEIYQSDSHSWYNLGSTVNGCVVLNAGRPQKVSKLTAQLRCTEKIRVPYKNRHNGLRFYDYTVEHYGSPIVTLADVEGRTVAAKSHRYPISFTLPSDAESVPCSYGYWYTLGGLTQWYGVKWFIEIKETSKQLRPVRIPIRVFPKRTSDDIKAPRTQSSQRCVNLRIPSQEALNGLALNLPGIKQDICQVKLLLEIPSVVYAGKLPYFQLTASADVENLFLIRKVIVSLHSNIRMNNDSLITFDDRSTLLAKWRTNTPLMETTDLSADLQANMRERTLWECDITSNAAKVRHYLSCRLFVVSNFGLRSEHVLNLSTPIKIAPPVSDDVPDPLPRYTA